MNHDDQLTAQLTRALHDHSDAMTGTSLGLAGVQGRARSIRRRRTASAVVGVAAVVGVLVPTVAMAGHTGGKPEPAPATQTTQNTQTTQAPTTSPTVTGTAHQPAPGVLDVRDLPTGAAPRLDFVDDVHLHLSDGIAVPLGARFRPHQLAEMDDGSRVWLTVDRGTPYVEIQDADGGYHPPVRIGDYSLALNAAHSIVAWVDRSGQVVVWQARASEPRKIGTPFPSGTEPHVAAITGDDCALACSVFVNTVTTSGGRQVYEVTDPGNQVVRDGGFAILDSLSPAGLTGGRTQLTDGGSCTKVLGGGEFPGWSTCRHQVGAFSPDGARVIGYPAYYDGLGPSSIAVLGSKDGAVITERRSTPASQAVVGGAVWEDDSHLLVAVYQGGDWSLVRVADDGTMEYAVAPVAGDETDDPFVLPTGGAL